MGYRHYFKKLPKTDLEAIKQCQTNFDLCKWYKQHSYSINIDDDEYFALIPKLGEDLYCFGKYADWAYDMQNRNESIFSNDEIKDLYCDYGPVICTKADFEAVINEYKKLIITYYESLLVKTDNDNITVEQKQKRHIENQLNEWKNDFGSSPINMDDNTNVITDSWLFEYAIFELVRLYKTFDWKHDALILIGW